jgi:hypothetical protein
MENKKKKKTSIIKPPKKKQEIKVVEMTGIDGHIQTALKSNSGLETLEKLLQLKNQQEDREASKVFHLKFSQMQSELPIIKKTKKGAGPFKYAPLEQIIKQIKPFLTKHGFSYHWTEEPLENKAKRIWCHLTGHGHEEKTYVDLPVMDYTKMTNEIQQYGSTSTYGKRYSLIGLLGIMADDDDDGQSGGVPPKSDPVNKWGEEENTVWKKIGQAAGILGKNEVDLKKEFQIKSFRDFDLKALKDFLAELNKQIDDQEKNNAK